MLIRRIARPMLASVFISAGIDAVRDPKPKADIAQEFVDKSVDTLPDTVTDKVPTEAETLVRINGAVQIGAGTLLAVGKFPRVASAALAGSLVPTTVAGHSFWNEPDPVKRKMQRTQFLKNVSLLGGLLIAAVDTEGKPSLAWRGRAKAAAAGQALSAALPSTGGAQDTAWESVRERSQEGAHALSEGAHALSARSAGAAELIRQRAPELAEAARERSTEAAELIRQRAPELAEAARERSTEVADVIRQRAPEVADELASLATTAREDVTSLAATAREKAHEGAQEGRRRARKARS
ncbi:DoxX family membrane protein [Gordonia sp. CPCC 206044]|uniref:DoxX family protein n=1 Tax=Gordonia sp. CPCC 206044 TaxID=3140793 RepID=UPI003AF363D3